MTLKLAAGLAGLAGLSLAAVKAAGALSVARAGLTLAQLQGFAPKLPAATAREYLPYLNQALYAAQASTPLRKAAFLAQTAHESLQFTRFVEIADGRAYEGRTDLGNLFPGDGPKYRGHGAIQVTGRANHRAAGLALGLPFEEKPELAAEPRYAFLTAAWYWASRSLNTWADKGTLEAFDELTRRINGGYNGRDERRRLYATALRVLGGAP